MADGDADQALTETLTRFGLDSLVSQPSLCRNTLRDKLPDRPRETALLVTALEAGVPTRLRTESRISDVETVSAQLAEQLEQTYGLSPESARWAVQTWASALDLSNPTTRPGAGQPPEGATVLRPSSGAETAAPAPVADVTAAPPPSGDVTAAPQGPTGEATVVPTPSDGPGGPRASVGEGTVLRSAAAAGATGAAGTAPPAAPTGPAPTRPKPGGRRNRRWLLIAGVLVLVGAIVGIVVAVSGGGGNSPEGAGGTHSVSTSNSAPPPSGSGSSSTSRTANPPAPTFAAISPELAHRGDHDGYPQETIPAFVQAAQRGFTTETDVRWSKDGVALITHDDATGRGMVCNGGPLTVADTNWQVLHSQCETPPSAAKTHRSYRIPTFDDTVHEISKVPGATVLAEIKIDQTAAQNDQFLAILQKWNMVSRTVVTSFVSSYLVNFDKAATRAGVAVRTLLFASVNQPTTVAALRQAKVWGVVFQEDWDKIPALMAGAKQAGIHVGISDVAPPAPGDGPAQWAQAKSLGAEFVLTDDPSGYHTWLQQH